MTSATELIEQNLFELYRVFAISGHYPLQQKCSFSWIEDIKGVFPRNIFNVNPSMDDDDLKEMVSLVHSGNAPPFIVFRSDRTTLPFAGRLRTRGFRQLMRWPGMAADLNHIPASKENANIRIEINKISSEEELNSWSGIVEQCLFNNDRIDRKTFREASRGAGYYLYLARLNGLVAGTLLSFIHSGIAGFYMITTLPECRNMGVAGKLTRHAMKDAADMGCGMAVLESTAQGLPLYVKAGFKEYCTIDIFWMLGKTT
jgi:ribosomal protein S18 acetylase RimI-like enzyme